jgi:hypothetical protein
MSLAFDEYGRPFIIIKVRRAAVRASPPLCDTAKMPAGCEPRP